MLVDRELSRVTLIGALVTLGALAGVGFFLTFLSQIHNIGTGEFTAATAFEYAALTLPQSVYDMFPVATLIGALFALGGLAAHQELMIYRVAGADLWRLARAIAWAGLVLAALTVLLGEFVAPPAKGLAETLRVQKMYAQIGTVGPGGVWLKSGRDIVHVAKVETPERLIGLRIYTLAADGGIASVRVAESAEYTDNNWVLHGIAGTRFGDGRTERIKTTQTVWPDFVLPATFQVLTVFPENLSWRELARYIAYLDANGLASARYETAFWHKIAVPISVLLMVILALPFALGRVRAGGAGQRLALGVVIGLVYYLIDRTVLQASSGFRFPPLAAAWIPTGLLGIAVLISLRRVR